MTVGNAKALALGNAVTADPPGIDSIHFNPAGLAKLKGEQYNLKLLFASFNFKAEFGDHDAQTQEVLDAYGYEDEASNSTSETSDAGLRVPFTEGITEWPLPFLVVPLGGASFSPPGSNMTFATAAYAPMAAGYIRDSDDPGRFMGEYLSLMKVTYFSPSIGVQLTDEWAVGGSLGFSWQGATVATELRVPNIALVLADQLVKQLDEQGVCENAALVEIINICGGDPLADPINPYTNAARLEFDAETYMVWNLNVGALWSPTEWFTWGFVYHFENTAEMEGTYQMSYGDEWVSLFSGLYESQAWDLLNFVTPFPTGLVDSPDGKGIQAGDAKLSFVNPAHFSTGISVQLTPKFKVNLDAKWTDWGVWEGLVIEFDEDQEFTKVARLLAPEYATLDTLTIPRHYESVWNWAVGFEYQYTMNLALRAGYEPRASSIPDDKQGVLLPLGDADLYTFGFSYQMAKDELLEFGFGYMHAEADIPAGSSTNANSTDQYNNFLYNPYAGTDIETSVDAILIEFSYTSTFD
ncbi:hypothetical protein A9Q99_21365 [Gammaproteobacteria bacterium 45_16_T64]|nr:hypothetical protein A9Q99_21365 [Gammaproteobacteria bacterium 45_16_T64]